MKTPHAVIVGALILAFAIGGALTVSLGGGDRRTQVVDESCHNLFRVDLSPADPVLRLDLDIPNSTWGAFKNFMADFASERELLFVDLSESHPDVNVLALSICNERGLRIVVLEQRWRHHDFAHPITGRGVGIKFYIREAEERRAFWAGFAESLIDRLEERWPGKVRFRNEGGLLVPKEDAMGSEPASAEEN
jgi:hypothetical protein